jgi:tRNA(Arg) A34 adenosine deaminase TadA
MCIGAAMQVGIDEIVFSVAAGRDGGVRYLEPAVNGLPPPLVRGGICREAGLTLFRQFLAWQPDTPAAAYVESVLAARANGGMR